MLVTFEDVTAHREIEALLKREGERLATQVVQTTQELDEVREELRALTSNLISSQEDERRHLARELHDDVSQRLALLDMDCGAALHESDTDTARSKLRTFVSRSLKYHRISARCPTAFTHPSLSILGPLRLWKPCLRSLPNGTDDDQLLQ